MRGSVIYPLVDTARFRLGQGNGEFYLIVSAFAPYKRLDLAIQACNALRRPLKIVGAGQDERKLRTLAGPTVKFLGTRSDAEIADLILDVGPCCSLVWRTGITRSAIASGRPVIPARQGAGGHRPLDPAAPRTAGPTGVFFNAQTVEAVVAAIERFEANGDRFEPTALREHALGFDRQVFKDRIAAFVAVRWATHVNGQGLSDVAQA
jgi:glycosyltransferase involved in cell wall biosynthesis